MTMIVTEKAGQRSIIIPVRSAFIRKFDVGEWTDLRIGMFFTPIGTASDSSGISSHTISVSGSDSKLFWGIKSEGTTLPGLSGSHYWGVFPLRDRLDMDVVSSRGNLRSRTAANNNTGRGFAITNGTTVNSTESSGNYATNIRGDAETNFSNTWCLRFVISDKGTSAQAVTIHEEVHVGHQATTVEEMINALSGAWPSVATLNANDTVNPFPIPNCFYFQNPFTAIRWKIHVMMVKKYA